jgi:ferredoxin
MKVAGKTLLLCSCEGSMPIDPQALALALGTDPGPVHHQLCRADLGAFRRALAGGGAIVACGQEAPLFQELAQDVDADAPLCVDIRDRAGWSDEAAQATPKMAALIAEAILPVSAPDPVLLNSGGRILVLGRDERALLAAERLAADRVVQLLVPPVSEGLRPPTIRGFAIWQGRATQVTGALGNWTVTVHGLAGAKPSSRSLLDFMPAQPDAAQLQVDVILDLSGTPPLVRQRDGWISADPGSELAVEKAIQAAHDLLGEFEKPRAIVIDPSLCAHSRNGQVGCTRCLDVCPSSALRPEGNSVVVDTHACSAHGGCASICPTGAIRYQVPTDERLSRSIRTLLDTYRQAGGVDPVLLLHTEDCGMIAALARDGGGLPAGVLPLALHSVTAIGPELMLACLAWGAASVSVLASPANHRHAGPVTAAIDLVNRITAGLGLGARVSLQETADPEALAWGDVRPGLPAATFGAVGGKRAMLAAAIGHLRQHGPAGGEIVALADGDPFGTIAVDEAACTLCMACAVACPSKALTGDLRHLTLTMTESLCTQCGLCRVTCPEKAIALVPRLNPAADRPHLLKQDEPFACLDCGKHFAPRSSIERMVERLTGHSMFAEPGKLDLIRLCEDCRGRR